MFVPHWGVYPVLTGGTQSSGGFRFSRPNRRILFLSSMSTELATNVPENPPSSRPSLRRVFHSGLLRRAENSECSARRDTSIFSFQSFTRTFQTSIFPFQEYGVMGREEEFIHFQHRFTRFLLNSGVIGNSDFAALKSSHSADCISLGGDLSDGGTNLCT
ncbi:hypothetical protein BK187_01360 [Brucella melitensis]|nr:hypothetical protein BK187_01360 [Brucella melitensis]EEZ11105.1 predicted protein [Brucella melitensis bv. 3 str. Ether]ARY27086.1 hypothetical protein BK219_01355 [Brucella melitensis]ARY36574.1 hypothetical protein BK217_01360 [Brucella melitensis]HAQ30724.1 hypothetical protein [Brucella melitensis]